MLLSNQKLCEEVNSLLEVYFDMNVYAPFLDSLFLCDSNYTLHRREKKLQSSSTFRNKRVIKADGVLIIHDNNLEILIIESSLPSDAQHHRADLIKLGHTMKAALWELIFRRVRKSVTDYAVYGILTNGKRNDYHFELRTKQKHTNKCHKNKEKKKN